MPTVLPVKFAYAARELWFDENGSQAQEGDHVICSTERGTEIGLACAAPREMSRAEVAHTVGNAVLKPVLRVADEYDLERADELARQGDEALPVFRRLINDCDLDMKPVGVEYLFGGEKVVCYFSAEERVDFRQLVRDLGHELHERIDMRQIGVREESAIVGGYGHCGQELCCARFGLSFEPVSIRMAKEQDLPLTSNKISGACGRLMCCLRYEFEAYRDFKSRAPKRNAVIETPLGKGKIIEYDTPKEQICLRLENGKQVRVALADMEASEAAHKKSEELGCPCRPDTVTRAALDKLESPEIKMALAELDRQMGIIPQESFDESELFVETKPRRRRRKGGAEQQQEATAERAPQAQAKRDEAAPEAGAGRSRRRRRKTVAPEGGAQQQAKAAPANEGQVAQASSSRRRRRHHVSEEGVQEAAAPKQQQQQGGQRQQDANKPSQDRPRGMQPKRRRRPGDKGGVPATQQASQPAPKHRAPAPQKAEQPKDAAGQDEQAKPKRRRRRRGSRGRGKGEGATGAAPGTES